MIGLSKEMSLVKAMIDYFGPDRKLEISEMRELSKEDKEMLKEMLESVGYKIIEPQQ